jgi:predicted DNA-binding protein (UPF0251 family)
MPRPKKWRKVCAVPENIRFGSLNTLLQEEEYLIMTIDEYETIRLIDLEGLTQEECASQMKVARTTIQATYLEARKKLATSLINQIELRIEGGAYKLCDGSEKSCNRISCCRKLQEDEQRYLLRKDDENERL